MNSFKSKYGITKKAYQIIPDALVDRGRLEFPKIHNEHDKLSSYCSYSYLVSSTTLIPLGARKKDLIMDNIS